MWLVFLVFPVTETLQTNHAPLVKGVGLALLACFGAVYVLGFAGWRPRALTVWLGLLGLAASMVPIIHVDAIGLTPFLGAYSALMVPAPWWKWTSIFSALLPAVALIEGEFPAFFFMIVWPIIGFCAAMRVFVALDDQAQETRAELALVAERDRVARDVHDVLGHSLTALSIKAELASKLIEMDPARAKAELESIQQTARQALAEVRATVGGLRAANLEAELATAPQVLADAGIETTIVGDVADTDPRHRALLAWVLRESVTNVVRHAKATAVSVELRPTGLVVADDGVGVTGHEGNGLRGMRERVSAAGGTLQLSGGSGTRVEVVLP